VVQQGCGPGQCRQELAATPQHAPGCSAGMEGMGQVGQCAAAGAREGAVDRMRTCRISCLPHSFTGTPSRGLAKWCLVQLPKYTHWCVNAGHECLRGVTGPCQPGVQCHSGREGGAASLRAAAAWRAQGEAVGC
jgi:hypothetical protein